MSSYVGMWKFGSMMSFDDELGKVYLTAEQVMAKPLDESYDEHEKQHELQQRKMMVDTMLEVCEDGKIYAVLPIPEGVTQEEIDQAVAEGEISLRNGMMVTDTYAWEEREDGFYFNTNIKGEILGENYEGWEKGSGEEGVLNFVFTKYVRA